MSDLHAKLSQKGDHHHSHGIVHLMIEGALIGGVAALLAHLVSNGMTHVVDKWKDGHPHALDADQLKALLGEDKIAAIAQRTGLNPDDVLSNLIEHLPGAAKSHAQKP
jgi:uncharacterized protein YidB (DUF937 family)